MSDTAWKNNWIKFWLSDKEEPENFIVQEYPKLIQEVKQLSEDLKQKADVKQTHKPRVKILLRNNDNKQDEALPKELDDIFSKIDDEAPEVDLELKNSDIESLKTEILRDSEIQKIQSNIISVDFANKTKQPIPQKEIVTVIERVEKSKELTPEEKKSKSEKLKKLVEEIVGDLGITRVNSGGRVGIKNVKGANIGDGEEIFDSVVNKNTLRFRTLEAGENIELSSTTDTVRIKAMLPSGSGEANNAVNIGSGEGLFANKTGVDLNFKSLKSSSNLNISASIDEILFELANNLNLGNVVITGSTILNDATIQGNTNLGQVSISGSVSYAYVFITSSYSASLNDRTIETTGSHAVFLPSATSKFGLEYSFKNSGNGTMTVQASGSETIDDSSTAQIKKKYTSLTVQSTGTRWIII